MLSFSKVFTLFVAAVAVSAFPAPVAEPSAAPEAEVGALEARQGCADVVAFFARGTTEPGTLGTVVGPPLERAVRSALGSKTLQFEGIPYPAVVSGFLVGGDPGGARTMAQRVTSTANACPNAKIVISGYSQGAQVTHLAAAQLSAAVQDRVAAVVTFGDPNRNKRLPGVLEGRRRTICNFGDLICSGQSIVLLPHLTYGRDTPDAARFIAGRA